MYPKTFPQLLKLIACVGIFVGGGWIMGLFTSSGIKEWYPHLIKSPLTPPDFVFPIVWTILYFLMGVSVYLVWSSSSGISNYLPWTDTAKIRKPALSIFALQIVFNFLWSFIFFYRKNPGLALLDMVFLGVALVATMVLFYRLSKVACYLLIPYFVWLLFAFYLNYFIWMHN